MTPTSRNVNATGTPSFADARLSDTAKVSSRQTAEQIDLREDFERRLPLEIGLVSSCLLAHDVRQASHTNAENAKTARANPDRFY